MGKLCFVLILCFFFNGLSSLGLAAQKINLYSPNHRIHGQFGLGKNPFYSVSLDDQALINRSTLNMTFRDGGSLTHLTLINVGLLSGVSSYSMEFGKTRDIHDLYNEYIITLGEKISPYRQIEIQFRLYDDGFAFRYRLPRQNALKEFVIQEEQTHFTLANNPKIYAIPLPFASSYEDYYRIGDIKAFPNWDTLILPLLLEYPGGQWVSLTEANLTDYAGMYVATNKTYPRTLETRLAPWPKEPNVKVRGTTPFQSPWRVLTIGDSPKVLIESNLIYNLNEPSVIKDTSWIKPGQVQFPWWNGYIVPKPDPLFKPGLNTWTLKHYIDFCSAHHIPYHSIDGFDKAWYGGPIDPFQGSGTTIPIPEINLPEVLSYAKEKGVGTRLWVHGTGLAANLDKALETYESWGIEGIMVDFLNRDDQEMVRFYNEVLQKTAAHHLTVNFHGVFKPTGLSRTYPNLLNHEAVLGTEYNKWSDIGSTPEHEVLIAYIRMLAGPLDTHQGSFHPVAPQNYHKSFIGPQTMGTLARQLAMYVVYENHLPMLADYPEAYETNFQALNFITHVPVTWDETLFLAGEVGKYITLGRRKGSEWYLGSLTDRNSREIEVPLKFLGVGKFIAEVYSDGPNFVTHPEEVLLSSREITSSDTLTLKISPAGGNAVRISRILKPRRPTDR